MTNVIKQILRGRGDSQTIKMVVRDNERGPQGEQGEPGEAASISVGETYTLPAGSNAMVQETGTSSSKVLSFGIPKGDKGDKGDAATVEVGRVTTLPAGYDVIVTNSGTSAAAILDFGIPQGSQGPRGYQGPKGDRGEPGQAATISIGNTYTLPAGSFAKVEESGTSSFRILSFGIPKGDKGDAATLNVGSTTTLESGESALVTNSGTTSNAVFDFGIPKGDPGDDGFSPTVDISKSGKVTTIVITDADGEHVATINDGADGSGSGDMLRSTYDIDGNGIVDNAEKVNGHTVATDVPSGAVFTDTTYTAGANIQISANNEISATDTTYSAGSNITISGTTISAVDTTYSAFSGATSQSDGSSGLVTKPLAGDEGKYLAGDGTWKTIASYSLPVAGASTLGGIKVGTNLSIAGDGTLSADAQPAILYSSTGQNTDGAMTQKAVTDIIGDVETILTTLTTGTGV